MCRGRRLVNTSFLSIHSEQYKEECAEDAGWLTPHFIMVMEVLLLDVLCCASVAGIPSVWNFLKRNSLITVWTFTSRYLQVCVVRGSWHSSWSYIIIAICYLKTTILLTILIIGLISNIYVCFHSAGFLWFGFNLVPLSLSAPLMGMMNGCENGVSMEWGREKVK